MTQAGTSLAAVARDDGAFRALLKHRSVRFGGLVLVTLILGAIFAPFLTPHDPVAQVLTDRLLPPSRVYPMGTDQFGRDVLSRVLYGGRLSIPMGLIPVAISTIIGVPLGMAVGYFRGPADAVAMRVLDVSFAIPPLLLGLTVVAVLGPGLRNILIALGFAGIPYYARMARGQTIQATELAYVEVADGLGASNSRIMRRHVLQNVVPPVVVMMSIGTANAILAGAALSFLGLGAPPPTPEWGSMLQDARGYIADAWWIGVFPGLAIALTVLSFNLIGDGLRDVLDPRSRHTSTF